MLVTATDNLVDAFQVHVRFIALSKTYQDHTGVVDVS